MRAVFVAPEEPIFLPAFFRRVIGSARDKVAAIVVVRPIYKNSSFVAQARKFVAAFGVREFVAEGTGVAWRKAVDRAGSLIGRGPVHSVKGEARRAGIPVLEPHDVNDPAFLDELRRIEPDLVVSISSPQIFKGDLIDLPKLGCINLHSSLLPQYRGVLPTFWAMAAGERETGVSVHYMNRKIDEGGIILQRRVPIEPNDTLHSLIAKCKDVGADAILEALELFERGPAEPMANRPEEGAYFSFPKREDVRRFRETGRRLR